MMKLRSNRGSTAGLLVVVGCIVIATVLLLNRQRLVDQIAIWQYQPASAVVALAERSSMNDGGRFYFYASRPALEDADAFNKQCARTEETTAILGCYSGRTIHIYNVANERLDGIREVTAAHEMLHAAYDRLSTGEKSKLEALLNTEYEKIKNDPAFQERMAFYDRTEPGERTNELHSIIGTEVGAISAELEQYYKNYFTDRTKVVALHKQYATIFTELQRRSQEISAELTKIAASVESESAHYNTAVAQLNQDIAAFNAKAASGSFASNAAFQAARAVLVTRASQLEAQRTAINSSITRHNQLREELATVASESEALNRSIDSSLAPAPQL